MKEPAEVSKSPRDDRYDAPTTKELRQRTTISG
jgi:hypothetical protein